MELEHPDLSAFEPELKRLAERAFGGAGRAFESADSTVNAIPAVFSDPAFRTAFRRATHSGFDETQQSVGEHLARLEEQTRALETEIRRLRRTEPDTVLPLRRLETLRNRALVLRRLMDTILYTLLQLKPWVARRLMGQRDASRLDPKVLRQTLEVAAARNAEHRDRFALVADLTTIVDVCDLVEVEMVGDVFETRFVELKGGRVNQRLIEAMKDADKSRFGALLRELGEKGLRQAERILKQQRRLLNVQKILDTDSGTDPLTGMELKVQPEEREIDDYLAALDELMKRAQKDSWALVTVDSSLRLVGVTRAALAHGGITTLAHALYHMGRPERACVVNDEARASEEMDAIAKEPRPVDLVSFAMAARWARPVFLWEMRPDLIMDLIFGRVRIFAQFNVEDFCALIHARGLQTAWVSRGTADRLRQKRLSGSIPGAPPGATALEVVGKRKRIYLSGFFWRVIGDMMRPKDLLQTILLDQERTGNADTKDPGF